MYFSHLSLSLITVARVHWTLQPCSSNQCDTARLETNSFVDSKTCSNMFISSHEIEHSFSNEAQRLVYRQQRRRTKQRHRNTRIVADSYLVHSPSAQPPHFFTPHTICQNNHFSATHLFLHILLFLHSNDDI